MPRGVTPTKSGTFQLCVKHKLLSKPFYHSFKTEAEADDYGNQLRGMLARGVVPRDLLKKDDEEKRVTPLVLEVMRAYQRDPNIRVATTELPTLALLAKEMAGMRMGGITFVWANELVAGYKKREMAPGTIRKRVSALGKVDAWYHRQQAEKGQQPQLSVLALLPRGYSQYADRSVTDTARDVRLRPGDEERVLQAIRGQKREDRERTWAEGGDPAFEMFFLLIIDTGMRLREAYKARVEHLDVERGVLKVEGSKGHHGAPKPRTVPLKRELRAKLKAWCEGKKGLMFPFWNGTEEDLTNCTQRLSARFRTLFDYAGVENLTEHDLRHEACCRWVMLKGERGWLFNELEICKIMGWTNTKMMLRYASLRGEDLSDRLL